MARLARAEDRKRGDSMSLSVAAQRFLAGPLLAELDDDARLALSHALREQQVAAGTVLISEGKPNDRLWFLIEGSAAVLRRDVTDPKPIARLEAPGIFGATTFFRPANATASIKTTTPVSLLTLDHESYEQLRTSSPRAAEALALATVRVLSDRFDVLDARLNEFIASHRANGNPKVAHEWADFRARLFEEPNII